MLLQDHSGPFHEFEILAKCCGHHSPINPMQVTILASSWDWSPQLIFTREMAKRLARFPQSKVTVLVPEGSCSERNKRAARIDGYTIVEAKYRPGIPNPIDWLLFPPEDLSTDIVVGLGEKLGLIAQIWTKDDLCKSLYVANSWAEPDIPDLWNSKEKKEINKGLCMEADIPIAIGPKMSDELSASLRSYNKRVSILTPGIISDFCDITHDSHAHTGGKFRALILGGDDPDKFEDEGLHIAAKAVTELKDKSYRIVYVGAGKDAKRKFAEKFHECGIAKSQLEIRGLPGCKEGWTNLFCEVDLAIMPSSEKQFGMEALLALSAGLPILVHGASGFGEALSEVEFGDSAIVDADDAGVWAKEIKKIKETERKQRLDQAAVLRSNYDKKYSWEKQCGVLVEMMLEMVSGKKFILWQNYI